jgi:hypothetical protein
MSNAVINGNINPVATINANAELYSSLGLRRNWYNNIEASRIAIGSTT